MTSRANAAESGARLLMEDETDPGPGGDDFPARLSPGQAGSGHTRERKRARGA